MLFYFEIIRVIANALLEAGINPAFLPSPAQHEFLSAHVAPDRYLYSRSLHKPLLSHLSNAVISGIPI